MPAAAESVDLNLESLDLALPVAGTLEGRTHPTIVERDDLGLRAARTGNAELEAASAISASGAVGATAVTTAGNIDRLAWAPGGGIIVLGWIDDAVDAIAELTVASDAGTVRVPVETLVRARREDVEAALHSRFQHSYGFVACASAGDIGVPKSDCEVLVRCASGAHLRQRVRALVESDFALLAHGQSIFSGLNFFGDKEVEAHVALDAFLGRRVVADRVRLGRSLQGDQCVARFGRARPETVLSIVLQSSTQLGCVAAQSTPPDAGLRPCEYEVIHVVSQSDDVEAAVRDARCIHLVHGCPISVLVVPVEVARGAVWNLAARHASTGRLVFLGPNVLPVRASWIRDLARMVAELPSNRTRLFGVSMFDGLGSAVTRDGVQFRVDSRHVVRGIDIERRDILRVEPERHFSIDRNEAATLPRRTTAIGRDFLCIDVQLFDRLEGFSCEYDSENSYEEADLCLRSGAMGIPPWLHDFPFARIEVEPARRAAAGGGDLASSWHFTGKWLKHVAGDGSLAQTPAATGLSARCG